LKTKSSNINTEEKWKIFRSALNILEKQIFNIIINNNIENLKTDGFVVIPNVLISEKIDIAKNKFY
jgi:hypothetical protein